MGSEEQQQQIVVRLVEPGNALWRELATHTHEMVICKSGRRIFPKLEYNIEGLDAQKMYEIILEFQQVDDFRYTFLVNRWVNFGSSEEPSVDANEKTEVFQHVDGIQTGKHWMEYPVKFDYIRVTSDSKTTNPSHVFLLEKHKYVPVLTINEVSLDLKPVATITIDYTQFLAVHYKYKNPIVKTLKITKNPLCKQYRVTSSSPEVKTSPPKRKKRKPATNERKTNKKRRQSSPELTPSPHKQAKCDLVSPPPPPPPAPTMLPLYSMPNMIMLPTTSTPYLYHFCDASCLNPNFVDDIPTLCDIPYFSPVTSMFSLSVDFEQFNHYAL